MTSKPSLWFLAAGGAAVVFVLTVFVMIAGLFSDPDMPLNVWLNRNGIPLLIVEVGLLFALGLKAMLADTASRSAPIDRVSDVEDDADATD